MVAGIVLMVLAGFGWVGVGCVVSFCAAKKINLAATQLMQALLCVAVGCILLRTQPGIVASAKVRYLTYASLFLSGIGNFAAYELMSRAMKIGPNGIIWSFVQSALIFPFLTGVIFFGDKLTPPRIGGMIALIVSILLLGAAKGNAGSDQTGRRWFWIALAAFIAAGFTQVTTNLPSYWEEAKQINPVMRTVWFQLGIAAGFFLQWALERKPMKFDGVLKPAICLGILYILLYFVLMFNGLDKLAAVRAGSVGFPVMLGSCIVGFFLYSLLFLKEKLTPTGAAGFLLCLAGIISISL